MNYNNEYRPSGFGFMPPVTKNIIVINVLLYILTNLLQQTQQIDLNKYLGLHYHLAPDFKPHQFITYLFMHGGLSHIFFNMFGVFIFGQVLEQTWGPKRFIIFYILTGLGAALTQYMINHFSITENLIIINDQIASPLLSAEDKAELIQLKYNYLNNNIIIGASGSLFGLLGAFGMLFPNRLLYLYFFIPVKAKWLVIAYGLLELFSGLSNKPGDNVAHFAHLGGLAVGIVIILMWRRDRNHFY
jgi:membrane associated rhomboid family serine protease